MDGFLYFKIFGLALVAFALFELYSAASGKGILVRPTPAEYRRRRHWARRVTANEAPFRFWLVLVGNLAGAALGVAMMLGIIAPTP